jgi:Protein of unknown function (DUF3592)
MKLLIIAGLVFGLAFAVGGALAQRRIHRLAKATSVPGTIVGFERSTWRAQPRFPTVDFRTLMGDSKRVTVPQGKVLTRVKVGKPVTVIYDPAKPDVAYIGSVGLRYGCYLYVIFGLCFAALAGAAFFAGG